MRVSSIGFATKVFLNVEINSGQTARLDVELATEAFESEEVTVVAQKPMFQKDHIGLDINLFYKNIRNLFGLEVLLTLDGIFHDRTVNRDYGLIKGGALSIYTNPTGYLFGAGFDITYQDVSGSSSDPNAVEDVIVAGR